MCSKVEFRLIHCRLPLFDGCLGIVKTGGSHLQFRSSGGYCLLFHMDLLNGGTDFRCRLVARSLRLAQFSFRSNSGMVYSR